jgi:hypothetical protein
LGHDLPKPKIPESERPIAQRRWSHPSAWYLEHYDSG